MDTQTALLQSQVSDETLNTLVAQIRQVIDPKQIILFGSAARGTLAKDSDLDILIVVPDNVNQRELRMLIRRNLRGFVYPVDILTITTSALDKHKDNIGLIYHDVIREGRTLYAA